MSDSCSMCGESPAYHDLTLVDRTGGAFVNLCDACVGRLVRQSKLVADKIECGVCRGRRDRRAKAEQLLDQRAPPTVSIWVCDECRREMLHSGSAPLARDQTGVISP